MVQMSKADQVVVKAMPGNDKCADCGMKNPQWASVSFGTVFCLECSGIHRSLGVHISFVRSIAMDSWTNEQLALMKAGGNVKCASYLRQKGVAPNTPIKQKYESPAAQLYKEVLKARVAGRPEPTELPKPSAATAGGGAGDPNGMQRLSGETDHQYIARQNRLKEEARARMANKFGGSSGLGGGGGGGGNSRMAGIGSDPGYNPNATSLGSVDVDSVISGFGSALSSIGSATRSAAQSAADLVQDEDTKRQLSGLATSVKTTGSSFWSNLSTGVQSVAQSITEPDGDDGLSELQQQIASQRPTTDSKYEGFGSNNTTSASGFANKPPSAPSSGGFSNSTLQEAPGLPGEDRNGIERLTGETDEQYVARQTRLRDEAKARMAAKFGNGGMGSAASSSAPASGGFSNPPSAPSSGGLSNTSALQEAPGLPGEDRNGIERLTGESDDQYVVRQTRLRDEAKARMAAKFGNGGMGSSGYASQPTSAPSSGGLKLNSVSQSAPSSGNFKAPIPTKQTPTKVKVSNSDDFFSSFGT